MDKDKGRNGKMVKKKQKVKEVKGGRILEIWGKYHILAINVDMTLISKLYLFPIDK